MMGTTASSASSYSSEGPSELLADCRRANSLCYNIAAQGLVSRDKRRDQSSPQQHKLTGTAMPSQDGLNKLLAVH